MYLCEEYALRKKINFKCVRHVQKSFLFFDQENKLLVIKWTNQGNHPGYYEISECLLDSKIKTIKNNHVYWEQYEEFILNWLDCHNLLVSDKSEVFNLVWQYFLRRNDKFFSENYDPIEIYETISQKDSKNILNAIDFLEKISDKHPAVFDFWQKKASDVISKYAYWMLDLKN